MIRTSMFGVLIALDGRLVWDDTLMHRKTVLPPFTLLLLSKYAKMREWLPNTEITDTENVIVDWLLEREILIDSEGKRGVYEIELMQCWRNWGSMARLYNFSTRTDIKTRVLTNKEDTKRLNEKLFYFPPPKRWNCPHDCELTYLADDYTHEFLQKPFGNILKGRRNCRNYVEKKISLSILSALLDTSAGLSKERLRTPDDIISENYYRAAPSGGARASTDVYVHARNVESLKPGNYKYIPDLNALSKIGAFSSDKVICDAICGQDWIMNCPVILILTANLESVMWKYQTARSYRALFLDAGHLSQVIQMVANALDLSAGFILMQRDELWENELNISSANEVIISILGIGFPDNSLEINV